MIAKQACLVVALLLCPRIPQSGASGLSLSEPENITAMLGQDVILPCPFEYPDGMPVPYLVQWRKKERTMPIFMWYKGYPPHGADDYRERTSLFGKSSLNLTSVRESDKGWYECKLYFLNRENIRKGTWMHLDVLETPKYEDVENFKLQ